METKEKVLVVLKEAGDYYGHHDAGTCQAPQARRHGRCPGVGYYTRT